MGSAKTVAAPDPIKTAQAQGLANTQAAQTEAELNRYNQTTPYGTSTWAKDPNSNQWSNDFKLDSNLQGMLDQIYKNSSQQPGAINTAGLQSVGAGTDYRNAADAGQSSFNSASALDSAGQIKSGASWLTPAMGYMQGQAVGQDARAQGVDKLAVGLGGIGQNFGDSAKAFGQNIGDSSDAFGNSGNVLTGQINKLGELYGKDFNYNSAPGMPTASDATRKAVEDAYYSKMTSRLDPQFKNNEAEMRSRLANQGITEGSEAYNRELQQFNSGRTDAYGQATNDAILNSTSEMQKQFQMEMQARQQGVSEANYLRDQPTKEAAAALGMYQGTNAVDLANRNFQANQWNNQAGIAGLQGGLMQGAGSLAQTSSGMFQGLGQMAQTQSGLYKDAAGLDQMQAFTQSQLKDSTQNRAAQAQAMDSTGRANQLNEMLQLRGLGQQDQNNLLNTLMALQSGSQVQAPGASQVQVGAAPVAQSIYNSQQTAQDNANAKNAASNQTMGTVGSIAAAAMMAF